ncbi:MAG: undecaprenyl diphosphate synthase family protein [Archaeoglobales archaeon]|nr:undecaprenyl diphosphate synthase family protein [Archaeoglobales archaeon]MDI9643261.1 undecaprenyl diphosphate synthase family protein [Archaeoglobales archaeon]
MLLLLYQFILERKIKNVPRHLTIICSEVNENFKEFLEWCRKFKIQEITICTKDFSIKLENVKLNYIGRENSYSIGEGDLTINVVKSLGREEIVFAIREIANKVLNEELNIEDLNESVFESVLKIRSQPDLIIKAGSEVPDFLLWQSIYSELYFADIDWNTIRYVDFLRILRDYQKRERRYGR